MDLNVLPPLILHYKKFPFWHNSAQECYEWLSNLLTILQGKGSLGLILCEIDFSEIYSKLKH